MTVTINIEGGRKMARANPKQKEITDKNFFETGSLLWVNIRKFGGSAQLTDTEAEKRFKEDRDVLRGVQDLLLPEDRDTLQALNTIKSEAHGYVDRRSMPHPLPCFNFIRSWQKEDIEAKLLRKQEEYAEFAQNFTDRWPEIEKAYAKAKPKLYRPEKYPSKAMVRSRFVFEWKWVDDLNYSNDDEMKKDLKWMQNYATQALKKSLVERMEVLAASCTNGKVSQATLDSIDNQIFEKYEQVFAGLVSNVDIKTAISDIKEYLEGTDAEMLRSDDSFKEMIAIKAKEIAKTVSKVKEAKDDRSLLI
jgi:disulfide oxidoreductase YuzD